MRCQLVGLKSEGNPSSSHPPTTYHRLTLDPSRNPSSPSFQATLKRSLPACQWALAHTPICPRGLNVDEVATHPLQPTYTGLSFAPHTAVAHCLLVRRTSASSAQRHQVQGSKSFSSRCAPPSWPASGPTGVCSCLSISTQAQLQDSLRPGF